MAKGVDDMLRELLGSEQLQALAASGRYRRTCTDRWRLRAPWTDSTRLPQQVGADLLQLGAAGLGHGQLQFGAQQVQHVRRAQHTGHCQGSCGRPISTALAPSAMALSTSVPWRTPLSISSGNCGPTAWRIGQHFDRETAASSTRPPWLDTTMASAPSSTAWRAARATECL
jgi:hypothetical protein